MVNASTVDEAAASSTGLLTVYCGPALSAGHWSRVQRTLDHCAPSRLTDATHCYYVQLDDGVDAQHFRSQYMGQLQWLLARPEGFGQRHVAFDYDYAAHTSSELVLEIGPRLSMTSALSTNAVSACRACGIAGVCRIERSTIYRVRALGEAAACHVRARLLAALHDRMTHCCYATPPSTLRTLLHGDALERVHIVDLLGADGDRQLDALDTRLGLAFDDWDRRYYLKLYRDMIKRNPTDVELFDLAQSNSEHSRHWFFKGKLFVDGKQLPQSLFDIIMGTQDAQSNKNNVIKFCDNSSAIEGFQVCALANTKGECCSQLAACNVNRHIIYTAETHNFPTGVCPLPGAATGTGGRIRDVHATGRGAHEIAGLCGYAVGNLLLPGYDLPWEDKAQAYPHTFASPSEIMIEASNGASDYGNKFGEPVLCGFARTFGMRVQCEREREGKRDRLTERLEYIKPIMFSGGVGSIDDALTSKEKPDEGMLVTKLGGPAYRIGVGGGSASSLAVQGTQCASLDYGAVQRGDAQMAHKLHRVIRACLERCYGDGGGPHLCPIAAIHDQGAGGNGNVLKELVEGRGAVIDAGKFSLGDNTLSVRELWAAEYQESDALLVRPQMRPHLEAICARERCPVDFVGTVNGADKENTVILHDFTDVDKSSQLAQHPVELNLDWALGKMPAKEFHLERHSVCHRPLELPAKLQLHEALNLVLRLPSVASKRYLTNKVDRSVTGLVAQQQCVGPLHTPVADCAVVALSHLRTVGAAVSLGEQPIKGVVDAAAGARLSVAEALTNIVFAPITCIEDIKCSGNWMWPAKVSGEGCRLADACAAMCDCMRRLRIAVDGGKDSLGMAASVPGDGMVKSPGTLVISAYAPCVDVTKVINPECTVPGGKGALVYVRMSGERADAACGRRRLAGTALAQCHNQLGDQCTDLYDAELFSRAFRSVQTLVKGGKLCAGHDVSDGGLITTLLEMAFAANCSIQITLPVDDEHATSYLFAEELGVVVECAQCDCDEVIASFDHGVAVRIGSTQAIYGPDAQVDISTVSNDNFMSMPLNELRRLWEETSFQLEKCQADTKCVEEEAKFLHSCKQLPWKVTFDYSSPVPGIIAPAPSVAILREEGSNGDREMAAAFHLAGFQVHDICMQDLLAAAASSTFDPFRGVAFVGGFSYADVLGSAKGWAAALTMGGGGALGAHMRRFRRRADTFSLGVCNGCQLMAMLGWVGGTGDSESDGETEQTVLLEENDVSRFVSYFNTVRIEPSAAIMFQGMENSVLGVWSSHGEGKFHFSGGTEQIRRLRDARSVPLSYVEPATCLPAAEYPSNPNGSPEGVAAVCSEDGRHLALMPHPERCFHTWQWPHYPQQRDGWPGKADRLGTRSPWMRMFDNALQWCAHTTHH